jgi:hypothetical protein
MSVVPAWQRANPGQPVYVSYSPILGDEPPWRAMEAILNWPGVRYSVATRCPDKYLDVWEHFFSEKMPGGHRRHWWEHFGLSWETKRMWYFNTPAEDAYARSVWSEASRRLVVHWRGSTDLKSYSHMLDLVGRLRQHADGLIVIDHYDESPVTNEWTTIRGRSNLRLTAALVSHSTFFMGFDSGLFYVALGSGVRCVGLFPAGHPETLFWPVTEPRCMAMWSPMSCERIPPGDVEQQCLRLMGVS